MNAYLIAIGGPFSFKPGTSSTLRPFGRQLTKQDKSDYGPEAALWDMDFGGVSTLIKECMLLQTYGSIPISFKCCF